jgi:hypothetical protein
MQTYRRESIGCDAVEITKVLIANGGKLMSSFVLCFEDQDIDKTKLKVVGGKATNQGNLPGLKKSTYRMAFVFLLKLLKESLGKRRGLTNYLISYRF